MVEMKREKRVLPTYVPAAPNELPFFLEKKAYQGATGRVYPIPYTDRLSNTPVDKAYDMVTLQNEYIEVELLPELGGKIHGATQKSNGYEFVYKNICIKPAMVGLAGPWVSGGVEFNWPQHHRPTTFMPTEATLQENPDGSKTCWMGEAEPFHRMRAAVGITVYPGSSVVEAKAVVCNRTDAPLPFMWWNNLAVRVHKDYKATFPPDVEWGNDHDRRAVISFPVMKGVFETARPFDYGEGTDATWFQNVKLPTSVMVMRGQSDMDFLGGYDFAADAGTVTVADHHYSVGKKMWTWGDGDFGRAWCANLTDNDDRYIELMTGVFTDNQPDFTYIMPGETKTFTQVWYPTRGIGPTANATREAALSFRMDGDTLTVGCITTSRREGAQLSIRAGGQALLCETVSVDPDHPVLRTVPVPEGVRETDIRVALTDGAGRCLVAYQPTEKGKKPKPEARTIPPEPAQVESLEELYLHGAHLEQYKHHTYVPEDYYMEALRRDPKDLRCNLAMGRSMIEKGDFDAARTYLDRAIARLKLRNDNPADPEAIYQKARLERLCGNLDAAYALYADASWQFGWRSACLFEMGCIDCARGDRALAVEHLTQALVTNAHHLAARTLLGYLTGDTQALWDVLKLSPQDTFARYALWLLDGREVEAFVRGRPQDVIDVALDFMRAGLDQEAARVLGTCTAPDQMICYYQAAVTGGAAQAGSMALCFPNRLEDIAILRRFGGDWQAQYLLGCLYYDRMNYAAAREAWERSAQLNPGYAFTWRNLAQALFDHFGEREQARACLEKALALAPDNARIVYELLQLYKNIQMPLTERLAFLESHQALAMQRDDCALDMIILCVQLGQYDRARALLASRRFNIYEGGEGKLTRLHGWLYTLLGCKAMREQDAAQALGWFREALVFPANYGEGRHYSAQEGQIHYYTGLLLEAQGDSEGARAEWLEAANQPSHISEISFFAGKSLEKLGRQEKARSLYRAMLADAETRLANRKKYGYFGVGMPSTLPFESDIERQNSIPALLIKALAERGLGDDAACAQTVSQLLALDAEGQPFTFFRTLGIL